MEEIKEKVEKFSYSKIDLYGQCGFKYKLKYVDGNYIAFNNVATEVGTLVHATEETIGNLLKENKAIDYISLKNNFIIKINEIEHKYPDEFMALDKAGKTYKDKVFEYLDKGIYRLETFIKENPNYEVFGTEIEFNFDYNEKYMFHGFIDRVFRDKYTGHYLVQDIKTYAVPVENSHLTTPLQFVVYTLALNKQYSIPFEHISCQYDLPFCNIRQDAGTKGYVARGIAKLEKLFAQIEAKDFAPNPTPLCAWCEFSRTSEFGQQPGNEKYNLCPYYSHWTRQNKNFSKENEWIGLENHEIVMESFNKKYNLSPKKE